MLMVNKVVREMAEVLPIVDVNSTTVKEAWPLLLQSIEGADFVALDMELSGLGNLSALKASSVEDRYSGLRETANTHAVLSMGLGCFQRREHSAATSQLLFRVDVFNIWLLCQKPFVVQPKSLQFLLEHGFDFNKQYSRGIHYTPGLAEKMEEYSMHTLFVHILKARKPVVVHNGLVDLMFLYQSFYADLPQKLGVFTADLSDMFPGGIYDTKCISEFVTRDTASFLEYIFRKSQRDNQERKERGKAHIELQFMDYTSHSHVDLATVCTPRTVTKETTAHEIELCETYAYHGYCPCPGSCTKCHDVVIILEQERTKIGAKRQQRKRRRSHDECSDKEPLDDCVERKPLEADKEESTCGTGGGGTDGGGGTGGTDGGELHQLFRHDLERIRSQLASDAAALAIGHKPLVQPPTSHQPSVGHRSGFDAFMTGYSLLSFALRKMGKAVSLEPEQLLGGLKDWVNCLALRGKDIPLRVVKSHFVKTSVDHQRNAERFGLCTEH